MVKIAVAFLTNDVDFEITCAKCHVHLKVTHQANDYGKNWIEIAPHTCKEKKEVAKENP
jgi:hypothetical protein